MDIGETVQIGQDVGYVQSETETTITLVLMGHGTYTVERGKIIGSRGKGSNKRVVGFDGSAVVIGSCSACQENT